MSYAQTLAVLAQRTRGTIKKPFIVGAVIDPGLCLNLTDEFALHELRSAYEILLASVNDPIQLPKNTAGYIRDADHIKRHLDCAVFETLHAYRADEGLAGYQSIRSPFHEGSSLYPGSGFMEKAHIQLCVRDPLCIKGYFRPRNEHGHLFAE